LAIKKPEGVLAPKSLKLTNGDAKLQTQVYEGLFIFDSNKFARDQAALPAVVEEMISGTEGGEVLVSRLWEERRLAYPISGQRKGTYWLVYFRSNTAEITPLNRKCELQDGLLRHLVIKIHPSLVEPIIAHAQGTGVEEEADEAVEETAGEPVAAAAAE